MYFGELNRHYRKYPWFWYLQGIIAIIAGVAIFFEPQLVGVLLLAVSIWFTLNGLLGIVSVFRGRVVRHLAPMMMANSVFQLVVGLLILLGPVTLLVRLMSDIGGFLLVFRGLLMLVSFAEAEGTVRYRRLTLLEALFSLAAGFVMFAFRLTGLELAIAYISLITILEGVSHLKNAWLLSHDFETKDEYIDTILAHAAEKPLVEDADRPHEYRVQITGNPPVSKPIAAKKRSIKRTWRALDLDRYQRPLLVTPHPDDLEGFAAGLVYALPVPAVSVVMAGGNLGVWDEAFATMDTRDYIRLRLEESETAARLLGVKEIVYMGYTDRHVTCEDTDVTRMVELLKQYQPDLVVSFEFYRRITPYPHPDHLATAQIVRNAIARYEHEVDYILTSTLAPNYFLDVSDIRRIKLEALACHTTQAALNSIIFPLFEKATNKLWGTFTGVRYAEGYRLIHRDDLLENLSRHNPIKAKNS